jgi:lipopolysaccharide export LptBFGC system permease protein LptF
MAMSQKSRNTMNNDIRKQLEQNLADAQVEVNLAQVAIAARRVEFTKAEDRLIDAREMRTKAEEALRVFEMKNDHDSTRDDLKDVEIERLRGTLPEALKKIENEPKLDYIRLGELLSA